MNPTPSMSGRSSILKNMTKLGLRSGSEPAKIIYYATRGRRDVLSRFGGHSAAKLSYHLSSRAIFATERRYISRSICSKIRCFISQNAPRRISNPSSLAFDADMLRTVGQTGSLTGEPPQIRIGANSEDHTNFNPNVEFAQLIFPAPSATVPYPEAINITVGDGYYATAKFLPPNTHVIWGLNLGQNNITSAFLNAKSLVKAFASPAIKDAGIKLDAIQIGNEADLYMNNGARPRTYNVTQYVKECVLSFVILDSRANHGRTLLASTIEIYPLFEFTAIFIIISTTHTLPISVSLNRPLISSGCHCQMDRVRCECDGSCRPHIEFAHKAMGCGLCWLFAFDDWFLASSHLRPGNIGVRSWFSDIHVCTLLAQSVPVHRFSFIVLISLLDAMLNCLAGLLQDLMTKSTIRGNLSSFTPDIAVVRGKGLDYVLGETNSYSCHGAPGVSNTAGAALWTLDYLLYATQIGISRVFFHEGIGFKYNLIQPATLTRSILDASPLPSPLTPHIQPQYYAAIIAAEAIGSSGTTRAVELIINHSRVAGYAFYEGGVLVRALLINSQAFFMGDTQRESIHVDLGFVSTGANPRVPRTMIVKRLSIPHAEDTTGLTWGGQTYETSDARVSGELRVEEVDVASGLDIQETEVVLLNFD
ncbi:unnamed protein product [Cyclocybe aegerita]|uniref:Beta-glucuronidase C-terminal domain-containing protein n=1 Tax=Cyclocybe aegerita TaxID=1973307 RepID=A0A8S0WVW6_CYCAE|nr:unnamed protein product [Cyclocybe aegerita]